ncbi:MAG: hypothetical protein K0S00_3865 [Xanthobacteraceae bacterium]|nr:hypothetical protein [Xanthobacteraceae bacterium]
MTTTPRTGRPKRALLIAVAALLVDDSYILMSRADFIGAVTKATGGGISADSVGELFDQLIAEVRPVQVDTSATSLT